MDKNNATEYCNTNLESSEPGLQDMQYLKLLGPTLESNNWLGNVTTYFIRQNCKYISKCLKCSETNNALKNKNKSL